MIELAQMHASRLANTAVDSIGGAREATADQIANYAGSDLLLYFAEEPQALVQRQRDLWGPVLDRVEKEARLSGELLVAACQAARHAVEAEWSEGVARHERSFRAGAHPGRRSRDPAPRAPLPPCR